MITKTVATAHAHVDIAVADAAKATSQALADATREYRGEVAAQKKQIRKEREQRAKLMARAEKAVDNVIKQSKPQTA